MNRHSIWLRQRYVARTCGTGAGGCSWRVMIPNPGMEAALLGRAGSVLMMSNAALPAGFEVPSAYPERIRLPDDFARSCRAKIASIE